MVDTRLLWCDRYGVGDEDYLFLGESFVNGLMSGEVLGDEGAIETWFRLR